MAEKIRPALRLMLLCMVAAVLLSVVNGLTKDKIEINTRRKIDASRREALGDYAFEDMGVTPEDLSLIHIYRGFGNAYVFAQPGGGHEHHLVVMGDDAFRDTPMTF